MKYLILLSYSTILLSHNSIAQNSNNIDYLDMASAYGYYYGKILTLDCIAQNNNKLKAKAIICKQKFSEFHKKAIDSITTKIKYNLLDNTKDKLSIIDCNDITEQYLNEFENNYIKGQDSISRDYVMKLLKYNPKYQKNRFLTKTSG